MSNSQKKPYSLSSWNYGSFHHLNPHYQNQANVKNNQGQARSQSANLNQYGKRVLSEEEKIVTEEYLKAMKEFKAMKKENLDNRHLQKVKSNVNFQQSYNYTTENNVNYNSSQNININTSQQNLNSFNTSLNNPKSKKGFKYQLSYEEWAAVKAKQQEIYNKVKIIKETEDQEFEAFNKRVDKNYKIIQDQYFKEWLQKKKSEQLLNKQNKLIEEEKKLIEKQKKEQENSEKLEEWFRRQAKQLEKENKQKKMQDKIKKKNEQKKQKEEKERKVAANLAWKSFVKYANEKGIGNNYNNISQHSKEQEKQMKRNSSNAFNRSKVIIGPYSNAKEMKDIQRKINAYKAGMTNYSSNETPSNRQFTEENNIDTKQYEEESESNKNIEEENERYNNIEEGTESDKNIEDSLPEISSIKKETPVQEQDYD